MPMANLSPDYALAKRLSGMEHQIRSLNTKMFPVSPAVNWGTAVGFAVPAAVTTVATTQFDLPQSMTTALISANAELFMECQPSTATGDWGNAGIEITASDGQKNSSGANGVWGTATGTGSAAVPVPIVAQFPSCMALFTGLTAGATITVSAQAWSGLGWSAAAGNLAEIRAIVIFLP